MLYSKRSPHSSFNLSFVILAMPELGYSNAFIDLENAIVILAMPGLGYANAFIDFVIRICYFGDRIYYFCVCNYRFGNRSYYFGAHVFEEILSNTYPI
ncbi:hypothetical protein [Nostoc sp. ChiQUE01b]|uniref:hypothetical protein n=1 Tax=Nostoc sp. ChiQUE01b TaxID=3075376 RepID=UPI002AD54CBC|nr:hypothetical protein [Nostoc sp. ChiQUE01b]